VTEGTLVISDIDGTLIDHPHFGGAASFEEKALACRRLIGLLRAYPVCLCSGRARHHYVNLLKHYADEVVFPWYFVAEFGAEVLRNGTTVLAMEQDEVLPGVERALRRWASEQGIPVDDDEGESAVEGICFELKRQSLDVEWNVGSSQILDGAVFRDLSAFMARLTEGTGLRASSCPDRRRMTVCGAAFQPKVSVWPEMRELLGTPDTIWVMGDEQIDVDMAEAIRLSWPRSDVRFASANPGIPGDVQLACGMEAIEFIESVLR
jgi:hypothetical protein